MTSRPRRSALYMPASNARAIAKARTLDCDVVILDLEDAVAPAAKGAARDAAVAAVGAGGFGHRELVVRINPLAGEWGGADLAALLVARPDAVLAPKVDTGADAALLVAAAGGLPVWAMIETPRAMMNLAQIAATAGVTALVMGTNDLAKDLRMDPGPDRLPLVGFLTTAVAAARAHELAVLDGVYNAIDDPAGLARECAQGARFGFDGKTLIHPDQIAACNAAFAPDETQLRWARRVVAAFATPDAAERGVLRVDGYMVERLHLTQAERLLAIDAAIRHADPGE